MKFTLWQIDKLRRGLHAYRVLKAANGELRPWKAVMDDVLLSPATECVYPKDGTKPDFREEALRRFAEGENLLLPDKLEDVRRFLLAARVVAADEFADGADPIADNLLVYRLIGRVGQSASLGLSGLLTDYRAIRHSPGRVEEFSLRLAPQPLDGFVLAEERVRVDLPADAVTRYDQKDKGTVGDSVRRGCALIASRYPTLHIFVRGGATHDFIHYVRVGTAGTQNFDPLVLVRSGEETPYTGGQVEGDAALANHGIIRFMPTSKRPLLPPERPSRAKSRTKFVVKGKKKAAKVGA